MLHHTSVGEMYSGIARCVCEREQATESCIVGSAVKSVYPKRELCSLLPGTQGASEETQGSVSVCLLVSVPVHTLRSLLSSAKHASASTLRLLYLDLSVMLAFLWGRFCP